MSKPWIPCCMGMAARDVCTCYVAPPRRLRGVSEGEWVRLAGDVLAHHWRTNPPAGTCSCGHEVPLGASFTEHQAAMLVNLTQAR